MRREGKQHGMVITFESWGDAPGNPIAPRPISNSNFTNRLDSAPPTAGMFSKVSAKPTNHSKYTGRCRRLRCRGCHEHPCDKAKGKTKGSHKIRRSRDDGDHVLQLATLVDDDYYSMDDDKEDDYV